MHTTTPPSTRTTELEAFLVTLDSTEPDAPTACADWTAHELVSHLAGGAEDIAIAVEATLRDTKVPATRPFTEREARFRALPDPELREQLVAEGLRLVAALDELHATDPERTVLFTGWAMTVDQLVTHVRSELALHRWDLAGDDLVSRDLLAQPELLRHGLVALDAFDGLPESRYLALDDADLETADRLLTIWGRRPAPLGGR